MSKRVQLAVLPVLLLLAAGIVLAQAPLTMTGAWVREPVPGRPTTAAYVVIENPGATDLRIVGAASEVAGQVELHEMVRTGTMMKMAPVQGITVPAHGRVALEPGGLHVMMFQLKKPLKAGDSVELSFTTDTGATVKTTAAVRKGMMPQ